MAEYTSFSGYGIFYPNGNLVIWSINHVQRETIERFIRVKVGGMPMSWAQIVKAWDGFKKNGFSCRPVLITEASS